MGFEPTTSATLVQCSTNSATRDDLSRMKSLTSSSSYMTFHINLIWVYHEFTLSEQTLFLIYFFNYFIFHFWPTDSLIL